ncbi:AVAST type 3 anti-phage proein Avs3b [Bradyrhizobium guangdongense]
MSLRSEKLIDLGNRIIRELSIDSDILGRWMAHYLAELITEAETASGDERLAKMEKCHEVILNLWKHRYEMPTGKRPFGSMEPILRALESLDPENPFHRYYRTERHALDASKDEEARSWIELADGLDSTAKILVRYCLSQAALSAKDKTKEWLALAEAVDADAFDEPLIRVIIAEGDLLEEPNKKLRQLIEDRLGRLEAFKIEASELEQHFRLQLKELDASEPTENDDQARIE